MCTPDNMQIFEGGRGLLLTLKRQQGGPPAGAHPEPSEGPPA